MLFIVILDKVSIGLITRTIAGIDKMICDVHLFFRYFAYDPRPEVLKRKTDAALQLLAEINAKKYDMKKMKPRENRVIAQVCGH